jgi:hypothetical protein
MGFNTGDTYEALIFDICKKKGLIKTNSFRAGASAYQADVEFEHLGKTYKLEVKNNKNPDYGQRRIHYDPSAKIWKWAKDDNVSQFYNSLNVLGYIDKKFNPIWYRKRVKNSAGNYSALVNYDLSDFQADQKLFENAGNKIPTQALFNYYANRNTHYIQIEGSGFYHLDLDVANLGTQQYDGTLSIRFRVKHAGHSDNPPHACQFMAVLKQEKKPKKSKFNLENYPSQTFPNIK